LNEFKFQIYLVQGKNKDDTLFLKKTNNESERKIVQVIFSFIEENNQNLTSLRIIYLILPAVAELQI